MISKKIIIYEQDILFEILSEIKDIFNLELYNADKDNLDKLKNEFQNDYLLISNLIEESNNSLLIKNFPIKLNILIETINIKFLKYKFNIQSEFNIKNYILNLNSREIVKDKVKLDLTERETNLIIFLKKSKSAVNVDKLQKEVWLYGSKLDTHTVETHIYRLRKKIRDKFKDDNFIVSTKEGYSIN
tara:strand:- start:2682 stop:3242 length:561 start_codon:yes stop_codon:yes gene_type:complete